jgi:hypothetical protein
MRKRRFALLAFAAASVASLDAAAQQAVSPQIETQQLQSLDVWSVSAVSRAQGGLAPDLWAQSDPAVIDVLFGRLPANYDSPATLTLARRVLFSGGAAPRGNAQDAARARFEALGRMGAADELATMAAGVNDALSDPEIAQYAAQAELARASRPNACARGRGANFGDPPPAFVLRLRAYCAAASGDRAAADLALELARASGADDAWYRGAVAAAAGAPGTRPPTARYDNSLAAQLSIAGHLRPGPNPLANTSTLALLTLARNDQTTQPLRAQAAALALARGALPAAQARAILHATPAEASTGLPPLAIALRQVEAAPGTLTAAAAISDVLRGAAAPADFAAAARFFRDDIYALQAAPDATAALMFARAALANGDTQEARRLITSARQAGADEATLAPLEAALTVLSGVQGNAATIAMQRRIDRGGASLATRAARDVAIMTALGAPLDGPTEAFLLAHPPSGGAQADPGAMIALGAAIDRRATGEAALLAVVAAQPGPTRLDAASLVRILQALRAIGLDSDARRFAVEAIVAGAPV